MQDSQIHSDFFLVDAQSSMNCSHISQHLLSVIQQRNRNRQGGEKDLQGRHASPPAAAETVHAAL